MSKPVKFYVAKDTAGYYLLSSTTTSAFLIQKALMASKNSAEVRLNSSHQGGCISEVAVVELTPLTDVQQKVLDDMKEARLEGSNPVETIALFSQQVQGGYSGYEIRNTEFVEVVKRFTFWIDERRS